MKADWGSTGRPDSAVTAGDWSARYTGDLLLPTTGTTYLRADVAGDLKVWVDGRLVIDNWSDTNGYTTTGTVPSTTANEDQRIVVNTGPAPAPPDWICSGDCPDRAAT